MSKTTTRLDYPLLASELEALRRTLRASQGVFSFSVAICNDVPLRDRLIDELRSSEDRLQVLPVRPDTSDLFSFTKRRTTDIHPSALFLVGFQNLLRSADDDPAVLGALNASRELWPEAFAFPVVFWLPEYAATLLSVRARDFWSWKSHEFQFGPIDEAAIARLAAEPGRLRGFRAAASLPLDRKLSRIDELNSRIAEAGPAPPAELVGHVCNWLNELGVLHNAIGDFRASIADWQHGLELARNAGDRAAEGAALGNLGLAHANLGNARRAVEYHEQGLKISREIGDRRAEANDLGNLGLAHGALGDTRQAIHYHEQALKISREIGDREGEGSDLGNLGGAYRRLGDPRRAIEHHEQALSISREIGSRQGEGAHLGNLGNAYLELGDGGRAIEYYEQALSIRREIGDRGGEAVDLWNMSLALYGLAEPGKAIRHAEEALKIFEQIEHPSAEKVREQLNTWGGEGEE